MARTDRSTTCPRMRGLLRQGSKSCAGVRRCGLSKQDRGIVHSKIEVLNQRGEAVMTVVAMNLVACR